MTNAGGEKGSRSVVRDEKKERRRETSFPSKQGC